MARKSREEMASQRQAESKSKRKTMYSVGIYVRLSVENSGKSEDKDVIANQIKQCTDFVLENPDLKLVEVYEDNGKSGTDFKRDGFRALIEDINKGKIDTILVRDFSRFGRNRLECLGYLNNVFPSLGIRFISIVDCYDSASGDDSSLKMLIQNMANEFYAHDISRKASTSMKTRMESGTYRKCNLPYGYMWNETRETPVIDEEVADFVKMIFRWKIEKLSAYQICKNLDELNAPLPEQRKVENGVRKSTTIQAPKWAKSSLYGILTNPHYVGDMVLGRSERAIYKGVQPHNVKDKNLWYTFPDTHPALISREDFQSVQDIMEQDSKKRQNLMKESDKQRETMVDLFKGKLFCSDCGSKMYFKRHKDVYHGINGKAEYWSGLYNCSTNVRRLSPPCTPHHFKQKALEQVVLDSLKYQVKLALDYDKLLSLLKNSVEDKSVRDKQNATISSLKLKVNGMKKKSSRLYTDYVEGILSQEEYIFAKESYQEEQVSLELRLAEAIQTKERFQEAMASDNKWITLMKSISKAKKLNQSLVDTTIEKILVHEDKTIELVVKYHDIFEEMIRSITMVQEEEVK